MNHFFSLNRERVMTEASNDDRTNRPNNPDKWKELFTAALLEMDDAEALRRIAVARAAIVERLEEWQSGKTGEHVEATALQDALHSLRCLENILRRSSGH